MEPNLEPKRSNLRTAPPFNSETGRVAGKRSAKVMTERKAVANALRKRKWCEPKCRIYFSCPFVNVSRERFDGKCALKSQDSKLQGMIVDILMHDDKIIDSMRRIIADMSWETIGDFRKKAIVFDKLRDLYETIHGTKAKLEVEKKDYKFIVEVRKTQVELKKPKEEEQPETNVNAIETK
jgi:hypothetical protein